MLTEVIESTRAVNRTFAEDIRKGLTADKKYLPSKYLYNKRGDEIFQEIMAMPEYYLTRAEHEIFTTHQSALLEKFSEGSEKFQLIEFGAGDGMKTKVLLQHFIDQQADFSYIPIDISGNILEKLTSDLQQQMPSLAVQPICDDYFKAIGKLDTSQHEHRVVLFLGANIGNFNPDESRTFLGEIASHLNPGDRLMIGFDLRKDPRKILNAYFDHAGVTASFKFNLLQRINEELGADFNPANFLYSPIYEPMKGTIKSYLVSTVAQTVHLQALDLAVGLDAWEAIYMERSQKFTLKEIASLAEQTGFKLVENFFDSHQYFTDSLWEVTG